MDDRTQEIFFERIHLQRLRYQNEPTEHNHIKYHTLLDLLTELDLAEEYADWLDDTEQ